MELRTFRPYDRKSVIDLWRRCDLTRPWNDPDRDIDRKLSVSDELFLVAEIQPSAAGEALGSGSSVGGDGDGGGSDSSWIVGVVMAGYDGHRGWVNYLAVDPSRQGRGIGRALMAEAERRLLALGCPKLNLQVRTGNEAVLAFYRALGYEVDATVALGKRLIVDSPASE